MAFSEESTPGCEIDRARSGFTANSRPRVPFRACPDDKRTTTKVELFGCEAMLAALIRRVGAVFSGTGRSEALSPAISVRA